MPMKTAQQTLRHRKHPSFTLSHRLCSREPPWSVCSSSRGQAMAAWPPAAGQPAPSRGRVNLLWFSKSCAGQFERLPFSREALHRVILRNPHLRLICRTKTSSHHSSCRSGAGSPARHVLPARAGGGGRHVASDPSTALPRQRHCAALELLCGTAGAQRNSSAFTLRRRQR